MVIDEVIAVIGLSAFSSRAYSHRCLAVDWIKDTNLLGKVLVRSGWACGVTGVVEEVVGRHTLAACCSISLSGAEVAVRNGGGTLHDLA